MRFGSSLIALALIGLPSFAFADDSVAGYWQADLGDNVIIEMNVTADGQWDSSTIHEDERIAEMAGKYTQRASTSTTGHLTFVPTKSFVTSAEHGAPQVEHDTYELSPDGQIMILTAHGDPLEFHKLTP